MIAAAKIIEVTMKNTSPVFTPVSVPYTLLDGLQELTCNCGRVDWAYKLPFRCRDCAAWWRTAEQVNTVETIITKPSLGEL